MARPESDLGQEKSDLDDSDLVLGQEKSDLGHFGPAGRFRESDLVLT